MGIVRMCMCSGSGKGGLWGACVFCLLCCACGSMRVMGAGIRVDVWAVRGVGRR